MSPVPCYLSSCSIDLSAHPITGQLIADARLADTGSLDCVDRAEPDGTDGVFVKVAGLGADATSGVAPGGIPCGQSLARATDGTLFAYPEGAVVEEYAGLTDLTLTPNDADYNGHITVDEVRSHDVLVTNPFDCPAWVHYIVPEMKIMGGRRPNGGGLAPDWPNHAGSESFYIVGHFNLVLGDFDGAGPAAAPLVGDVFDSYNNRFDIHGSWSGEGNSPNHQLGHPMQALFQLAAGASTVVRNRIVVSGRHHFAMGGTNPPTAPNPRQLDNVGIAVLHPAAIFWRVDARP